MRLILYIKGILPPILKSSLSPLLIKMEYEFKSIYKIDSYFPSRDGSAPRELSR
jgi:hypothetical protein